MSDEPLPGPDDPFARDESAQDEGTRQDDPTPGPGGPPDAPQSVGGFLGWVERAGNRLPDPATLFLIGTVFVMVLSAIAVALDWSVAAELPKANPDGSVEWVPTLGPDGEPVVQRPVSILDAKGLYWFISSLVSNFMAFPPLGIVLVGMLGIGVAERVGLIGVLLKLFMRFVPAALLTPALVFAGIMSSFGLDAGYIVLPPLAAMLYRAAGRSPLAGIAAVSAGVAAGFNANLLITATDPMLAEFTQLGARTIDDQYVVSPTCNYWFAIASTFVITLAGWFTTSFFVERRLSRVSPEEGGPLPAAEVEGGTHAIGADELRGLKWAAGTLVLVLGLVVTAIVVDGWALQGFAPELLANNVEIDRWVRHIVPLLFFVVVVPSLVYGARVGKIKNDKDAARMMVESVRDMAPIIVLAFFAAQFIACFQHSGLDRMAALAGGQFLGKAELPSSGLVLAFIGVTMVFNLFVGSMSAKYAMFAPIFVPMLMLVGISPELTQAAYRIGDSVTNIITPLNAYLVILLVFMKDVNPKAGMGTLVSTMLPYTFVFTLVWCALILLWMQMGWDLGIDGPLTYDPVQ
ncbi:MAG: AbgT family transporter [Planctomycetota bacterium]